MDGDLQLLRRMQNGDEGAIDSIVRRYYPMIPRYCRLHIRDQSR